MTHNWLVCDMIDKTCLIHMRGSWDVDIWRDSFICQTNHNTWLIHMWHVMTTHSYVTWLMAHAAFICDTTRAYAIWLIDVWHNWQDLTHLHVTWWLIHMWHESWHMLHSCVTCDYLLKHISYECEYSALDRHLLRHMWMSLGVHMWLSIEAHVNKGVACTTGSY